MNLATPSGPVLLEMQNVAVGSFHAPNRVMLRDVNWRVVGGDFWIIAGPHGSGRTDFLLTAAGLLPPCAGSIRWFDQPPPQTEGGRMALRRRIGFVFEHGHLLSDLTVTENLALPLEYHGPDSDKPVAARVAAMLEAAELGPWANSRPGHLPPAWQRRVLLARALMLQPRLLFLDCPLRGLDRRHADWWRRALLDLHAGSFPGMPHAVTLAFTAEEPPPWSAPGRAEAWIESGTFRVLHPPPNAPADGLPDTPPAAPA